MEVPFMKRRKPGHNQALDDSRDQTNESLTNIPSVSTGGFKMSWLLYGAAAYYGLRLLSKRGFFPASADQARDLIDRGINTVKQQVGMNNRDEQSSINY
jgi:hypothetical protein